MFSMNELSSHMHKIEGQYQECKNLIRLPDDILSYFLKAIDASREILQNKPVQFDYLKFQLKSESQKQKDDLLSKISPPPPKLISKQETQLKFKINDIKVLVVDDETEIVDVIMDLLNDVGFETIGYTSPYLAIENINRFKPDVVVTDFKMPEMSGLELLKKIREFDIDLPVIFISGHLSKEVILESIEYGVFGGIEKPYSPQAVISICKNAAERYKLTKILNRAIALFYYQYSDLDQYLLSVGSSDVRRHIQNEYKSLIEAKRKLKFLKQSIKVKSAMP